MRPSEKSKKIYPPYRDGQKLVCSRCFGLLGPITQYGYDAKGYWFIALCKLCQTPIKWYRDSQGAPLLEESLKEEGTFGLMLVDGEPTFTLEE